MKRIAAPMIDGIITSTILKLIIYPARLRLGDIKDICNILRLRRDNSTYKFQFATLLKLEFH